MIAVGTIVAKNYLPFARVLADSLGQWHPEVPIYVALVDEPEGLFDPARERFRILELRELGIPRLRDFCFRYTRREAVSAVKPYLLTALLDMGYESALFLDADMQVLGDLSPLLERVSRHPLTLSPHTLAPGMRVEAELNVLQCGVFNGGVMGASETPGTREFLSWWRERTREHCRCAFDEGMHLDQRWLDYAPSFVPGLAVERDPAYNVAYWNLFERTDTRQWRLFHYSGFDPMHPEQVSRYWPARRMEDTGAAAPLFQKYATLVMAAGFGHTHVWPYAFDHFDNGEPIPLSLREFYGRLGRVADYFADPFGAEMREWAAEIGDAGKDRDLAMWRHAAEERLLKLQEANVLLAEQQAELDAGRNALNGALARVAELTGQGQEEALAMYRRAAEERLLKLQEANVLLAEQQEELNRLRVALAEERARADWLTKRAELFERAAVERLALLEKSSGKPESDPDAPPC